MLRAEGEASDFARLLLGRLTARAIVRVCRIALPSRCSGQKNQEFQAIPAIQKSRSAVMAPLRPRAAMENRNGG